MLELNGELHEMPPLLLPRAEHLLCGICRLIGAQVALFSDLQHYLPGWQWKINPLMDIGWSRPAERKAFMSFFEGAQLSDPLTPLCTKPAGSVVTVLRRQMVDDRAWYRSPNVNELRRMGRLDDCIYSHFRLNDQGRAMGIAFHRPWGDKPFGERERAIVDLMHRAQPLYRRGFSLERRGKPLSPRQEQVLAELQEGRSEKEAAANLGVSTHTVHTYVKALYERFDVSSRSELLSLWVKRGSRASSRL
jgi:DNA-binding CsgD family transcriptional regulator